MREPPTRGVVDASLAERLRELPSVDEVLARASLRPLWATMSRALAVQACREAVDEVRQRVLRDAAAVPEVGDDAVARAAARVAQPKLRRVINATGVVLHTNLGRAPLAARAVARLADVAAGYCNLELDLDEGERGSRYAPVVELLCALTQAEDALVVNNGAAAVLLVLSALAAGREAIVSRGELVEIGGLFRIPDVMRQAGVRLVEVGSTNRTRLSDYAAEVRAETALVLKVHQSNFAQVGFAETVPTKALAALAHQHGVPLYEDVGSGVVRAVHGEGVPTEPTVASVIAAGADLVSFSGDKLLGGPQAGVVVGTKARIAQLRAHPLNRALRVDKLTVAALEATLEIYRDHAEATELPAHALLVQPVERLRARAERLRDLLPAATGGRLVPCVSQVGGGAMPLSALPSWGVALEVPQPEAFHDRLRSGAPAVVARLHDGAVLLDVRCVAEAELELVARAVAHATGGSAC